jgi:catechol 2,3-dioxygenase-like lactoylglutathione lyase family enzyme
MVKTYGLTHLAIGVRVPARAYAFYRAVLGMEAVYTESNFIQAQTPGTRDVLVFERAPARAGRKGGIAHFGFRLMRPEDISKALQAVEAAGGRILSHGEFCPGEPYLFCEDPDGYEVEIWYELPTPIDPKPRPERSRAVPRSRRGAGGSKKTA